MDTNKSIAENSTFIKPFLAFVQDFFAYIYAKRTFAKAQAMQLKIPVYCRFFGRILAVLPAFFPHKWHF
jgi:hypothetical protein